MSTFSSAVQNREARTENGMKARASTGSPVVDFFYKVGASRGQNVIPHFSAAFATDMDRALRTALWARDIRAGAGERKIFRDLLVHLAETNLSAFQALARKTPELGRWDDLLVVGEDRFGLARDFAFDLIKDGLANGDGLCAKWMPRKGPVAAALRAYLGWTPKYYRKRLVELTKVVETQMCANEWDAINYNHVPSVAASRYKKAFMRHSVEKYKEYAAKLAKGDKDVKINASSIFPYDVLRPLFADAYSLYGNRTILSQSELQTMIAQWNALPNYVGAANVLPLVDVSGSMCSQVSPGLSALQVAVSLGLYFADKNQGKFHGTFLTFSARPQLVNLVGDISQKVHQMNTSKWEMNTNLHAAFEEILRVATKGNVPQSEMPEMLLIMSDMQFDACVRFDDSAIEMMRRKYKSAGYEMPSVVFWNINSRDNTPVKSNENGVALVSGFSPAIAKMLLAADANAFTPEGIMDKTIMQDRYNWAA